MRHQEVNYLAQELIAVTERVVIRLRLPGGLGFFSLGHD